MKGIALLFCLLATRLNAAAAPCADPPGNEPCTPTGPGAAKAKQDIVDRIQDALDLDSRGISAGGW